MGDPFCCPESPLPSVLLCEHNRLSIMLVAKREKMSKPSSPSSKTGSTVLAELIRERRQQLGISRQELAETTGVPYSTVAQIETAYRGVSPSRLGVIARALQLDPKELYDVLASKPTAAPAAPSASAAAPTRQDRGDDSWHQNPSYVTAAKMPRVAAMSSERHPERAASEPDIVARSVELLSQLPPERRLEALAQVQTRLLNDLVEHEVQRRNAER